MQAKTLIVGCKAQGHDAALFIVAPEGKKVFAMATERLTRRKHDRTPPLIVLKKCIEYWDLEPQQVERVVVCNSFMQYEPRRDYHNAAEISYTQSRLFPFNSGSKAFQERPFLKRLFLLALSVDGWRILAGKLAQYISLSPIVPVEDIVIDAVRQFFPGASVESRSYDHHHCHASCTYMTSPFERTTVLTFDGWGDEHCSEVYVAERDKMLLVASSPRVQPPLLRPEGYNERGIFPSIGAIYQYFTGLLGFNPRGDEGKVEALAAYGKPIPSLLKELHDLIAIDEDLSMNLDAERADSVLGKPRLLRLLEMHGREAMAATVQTFLEEVTAQYVPRVLKRTGIDELALAGGIAANVINNLLIFERMSDQLHITPAMADDGSAQGAAYAYLIESGADISWLKGEHMPYWGTSYSKKAVQKELARYPELVVENLGEAWPERVAERIVAGEIGAIFHGRMEWGPRALGNRSILADARRSDFRERINKEIKRRPLFQPFCPSILAEEQDRLFARTYNNKHMTCAFRLKREFWEQLPSAIHIDGTARAQFVEERDNPAYYRLLKKMQELTGTGIVINTSFNKHGRTIVESPRDAMRDFLDTNLDYLCIEGFLVRRKV